jgi:hypothetical protein
VPQLCVLQLKQQCCASSAGRKTSELVGTSPACTTPLHNLNDLLLTCLLFGHSALLQTCTLQEQLALKRAEAERERAALEAKLTAAGTAVRSRFDQPGGVILNPGMPLPGPPAGAGGSKRPNRWDRDKIEPAAAAAAPDAAADGGGGKEKERKRDRSRSRSRSRERGGRLRRGSRSRSRERGGSRRERRSSRSRSRSRSRDRLRRGDR